jgi:hypothetical protein
VYFICFCRLYAREKFSLIFLFLLVFVTLFFFLFISIFVDFINSLLCVQRITQMSSSRSNEKQTIDDCDDDRDDRQSKLLLLFTEQWRDLFENYISKELNQFDLKRLYSSFKDARLAIKRSGIRLQTRFKITELTSISQLEVAWDNYHYGVGWHSGWFCQRVAEMNKLEYLVWLREVKNCDWDLRTINRAAKQGNLAIVKYCVENKCPMDASACRIAARKGHLDVLKYLHENDRPWDSSTIAAAAEQGNLAIVKYCVENGCPMDAYACKIAASEGHLDVLKYLHENDCPWNSDACYLAHLGNHVDCLNYLIEQRAPGWRRYYV